METVTYTTISGIELTLQAVPQVGLQSLLFGFVNNFNFPSGTQSSEEITETIKKHFEESRDLSVQSQTIKLLNYIVSFGIKNEPPADAIKDLTDMGFETSTPLSRKRNWLMMLVLDNDDVPELLSRIIQLTYQNIEVA